MEFQANLRHLAAIPEISRLGSINKAAEYVHLSQSALTQGLGKIEKELGVYLFDRSATGMYPTEAGKVLLSRLGRAFQNFAHIEKEYKKNQRSLALPFSNSQLRALIAVVDERNISLAARTLSLAQPTVQRAVREVESICGKPLFVRSATGVEPTQLAIQLAQSSSLAFSEIQSGVDEVYETQGQIKGRLVIGSLPLARTELVPASVTQLLKSYPSLKISIVDGPYEELLHGLSHGKIDLIIGALRKDLPSRSFTQEPLFEDTLSVIVRRGHPLLTQKNSVGKNLKEDINDLSFKTLNTYEWIAPRTQTPARSRFQEIFATHKMREPAHIIECSSSVAIRGLLLRSDRLALLSLRQVQLDIDNKILAVLPMKFKGSARTIGLTMRKAWCPTAGQQEYLDTVRNTCESYRD